MENNMNKNASQPQSFSIERWTKMSIIATISLLVIGILLSFGPVLLSAGNVDRITSLFIYIILAVMWNALAGYGGLISIGQQAFFGLGAYAAIRFSDAGVNVYFSLFLAAAAVGLVSIPISHFMLKLKGGEFAIGMWVLASLAHLLVNLDSLIQGETGTSLIALSAYETELRRSLNYWVALGAMVGLLAVLFFLLRSRVGTSIQAIRDNEGAAASLGVRVQATKRLIFILAAFGAALAGALWLSTAVSFQPKAYFGVHWTAYMIFMVLVGGIGTFEGAIIGAIIFFLIETWFGDTGVWYLIGLGGAALIFALFFPKGIWGFVEKRFGWRFMPVGYQVNFKSKMKADSSECKNIKGEK